MKKRMGLDCFLMLFAFTLMSIGMGCNTHPEDQFPSVGTEELVVQANRLDSNFLVAFNNGDVDALMKCYWNSPELTTYPPAGVMQLKGYDGVREFYIKDFSANKGAVLEYSSNTNMPFKYVVIGQGTFKWSKPGEPPMEGRHTVVKALKDGKMVIVLDHISVPITLSIPADSTKN